ncbi:MAG: 4Fe-4S dicluster domain-containing protein [Spirochaetes bacterium]|nr:4Fe-4S dicluster domain-containing protein [Spirochaetota bacterium]
MSFGEKTVLGKDELFRILKSISEGCEIIGPVMEDGKPYFRPVEGVEDVAWDFDTTVNGIKEFFFPRRSVLYEQTNDGIRPFDPETDKKRIVLFSRPCDARALTITDRLFMGENQDRVYGALRANTVVVGLSCEKAGPHCFCLSVGGSPFGTEGMDVSITAVGDDEYVLDMVTDRGKAFFGNRGRKADSKRLQEFETLKKRAEESVERTMRIPKDLPSAFESDYWKEVSAACLKCGVCTYLCPTCHCFDIVDEGFYRVRCWDTCSFDTFSRMASGEDPRKDKYMRYRQRVYHKFSYYKENFGVYGCVGCGRCTKHCPVKTDIVEIVSSVDEKGMP